MDGEIRFIGDLQRLEVKPGDKFVLKVHGPLSDETCSRLKELMKEFLGPDAKVCVIAHDIDLGVLSEG